MMMRLATAGFALVAFVVPMLTARPRALIVAGLIGLLLTAIGIATLWRWPITVAACGFSIAYAAAVWPASARPSVGGATAFGLSLLLMLHSAELARCTRRSTVAAGIIRSQTVAWLGFAAGTLSAALLIMALAAGFVASIPIGAAPLMAAAGALGTLLVLAAMAMRPGA
jgi:hypothetical protein